jgi:hypothetical protein
MLNVIRQSRFLAAALLVAALPALADAVPQASKDLQCLVGNWKGTGVMHMPDGSKANAQVSIDCKSAAGGLGVACHTRMTGIPGMAAYEEDDLFGYNAGDGLVHWFSITSAGETHDHKGGIADNAFVGVYEGPQGGQLFQETVSLAFEGEKKMKFRSASLLAGKDQGVLEGTLTK